MSARRRSSASSDSSGPVDDTGVFDPASAEGPSSPHIASRGSRYSRYECRVDQYQNDRATEIRIFSFARPHSRALHCAWISFFLAFTIWFAVAPLLPEIQGALGLSKADIWMSSICSDLTTIFLRVIIGPICDKYGSRVPMGVVLCVASIPTAMLGLVNSAAGLCVLRLFIGIAGSTFVMAQHWPTIMYTNETAGTANGIVGGWGNLGGAFTQILMGSVLFPAFTDAFGGDRTKAWRTVSVVPAFVAFMWGMIVIRISDDAPKGYYREMRKNGSMDMSFYSHATTQWYSRSLRSGTYNINTWILWWQYACCFGVELIMNNAAVLYFTSKFHLSTESAAAVGSIFGWMNIFARGVGGFYSDKVNLTNGLRGRLWLNTVLLVLEGAAIIAFAYADTLGGAIALMSVFSLFTQAAEGSVYGVVPYVNTRFTGTVAGIVGAGGNAGGVLFGFVFRSLDFRPAFLIMGAVSASSALLSFFVNVKGHAGMVRGTDSHQVVEARERHLRVLKRQSIYAGNSNGEGGGELSATVVRTPETLVESGHQEGGEGRLSLDEEVPDQSGERGFAEEKETFEA